MRVYRTQTHQLFTHMKTEDNEGINPITITLWTMLVAMLVSVFMFCNSRDEDETRITDKQLPQAPAEVVQALKRIEDNTGNVDDQRTDLMRVTKAMNIGEVTSKMLGKKSGDHWLRTLRDKINGREAIESWKKIQNLEKESQKRLLDDQEVTSAERLNLLVETQMNCDIAVQEGLTVKRGELFRAMYRIRNHGQNPT